MNLRWVSILVCILLGAPTSSRAAGCFLLRGNAVFPACCGDDAERQGEAFWTPAIKAIIESERSARPELRSTVRPPS